MADNVIRARGDWWPDVLAALGGGELLRCYERTWSDDAATVRSGPFPLGPRREVDAAWFEELHRCLADESLVLKGMAMLHRPDPGYIVTTDEDPAPRLLVFIDLEGRQVGSIIDGEERWFDCSGTSEPFARLAELLEGELQGGTIAPETVPVEEDAP